MTRAACHAAGTFSLSGCDPAGRDSPGVLSPALKKRGSDRNQGRVNFAVLGRAGGISQNLGGGTSPNPAIWHWVRAAGVGRQQQGVSGRQSFREGRAPPVDASGRKLDRTTVRQRGLLT